MDPGAGNGRTQAGIGPGRDIVAEKDASGRPGLR